jgi:hypothetical protein
MSGAYGCLGFLASAGQGFPFGLGLFFVSHLPGLWVVAVALGLTFGLRPLVKPYVRFSRIRLSCALRLKLSE